MNKLNVHYKKPEKQWTRENKKDKIKSDKINRVSKIPELIKIPKAGYSKYIYILGKRSSWQAWLLGTLRGSTQSPTEKCAQRGKRWGELWSLSGYLLSVWMTLTTLWRLTLRVGVSPSGQPDSPVIPWSTQQRLSIRWRWRAAKARQLLTWLYQISRDTYTIPPYTNCSRTEKNRAPIMS